LSDQLSQPQLFKALKQLLQVHMEMQAKDLLISRLHEKTLLLRHY